MHGLGGNPLGATDDLLRLALVSEDDGFRKRVSRALTGVCDVRQSGDPEVAAAWLRQEVPDFLLVDGSLPEGAALNLLLTALENQPDGYRVLVADPGDYELVVEAVNRVKIHWVMERHLDDADIRQIIRTLRRAAPVTSADDGMVAQIGLAVDDEASGGLLTLGEDPKVHALVDAKTRELVQRIDTLEEERRVLQEMVVRDGLTGLFNHRTFIEQLELEVARSRRYGREFVILFLDLDHFKAVNDTHGHGAGDIALKTVSELLKPRISHLRYSDFAARYGGEEFCVILPETGLHGGKIKADRLRATVESLDWPSLIPGLTAPITTSIGVAAFPGHGTTSDELLSAADAALYRAKQNGRNRVEMALPIGEKTG